MKILCCWRPQKPRGNRQQNLEKNTKFISFDDLTEITKEAFFEADVVF